MRPDRSKNFYMYPFDKELKRSVNGPTSLVEGLTVGGM
jgi:hypothetical protein